MRITDEVKAFARALAQRRCECQGPNCRHHRDGARCKRGLRGDQWKVYWHSEDGGVTPENLDAWCLDCFASNFTVPTSSVTILSSDIVGLTDLADDDGRKAITALAVLRDAADTVASDHRGRRMNTGADDVQLEFANTRYAVAAARALHDRFHELACKLNLPTPELCTGIHSGEVTRSRDGDLFGETLGLVSVVRRFAGPGEIVLSDSVVDRLGTKIEVEDMGERAVDEMPERLRCWSLRR